MVTFWCLFDDGPMMFWWCFGDCLESLKKVGQPTRWISRFSQQIKVSTAPISKAYRLKYEDLMDHYNIILQILFFMQHHGFDKNHLQCVIHTKTVFASVLGDLVKIPERGIFLCVKIPEKEIFVLSSQNLAPCWNSHLPISFFSWMNFTLANDSAASSMAWNKNMNLSRKKATQDQHWRQKIEVQTYPKPQKSQIKMIFLNPTWLNPFSPP